MRHVIPDGDPAKIFDRALMVLLADLERKKFAATSTRAALVNRTMVVGTSQPLSVVKCGTATAVSALSSVHAADARTVGSSNSIISVPFAGRRCGDGGKHRIALPRPQRP